MCGFCIHDICVAFVLSHRRLLHFWYSMANHNSALSTPPIWQWVRHQAANGLFGAQSCRITALAMLFISWRRGFILVGLCFYASAFFNTRLVPSGLQSCYKRRWVPGKSPYSSVAPLISSSKERYLVISAEEERKLSLGSSSGLALHIKAWPCWV